MWDIVQWLGFYTICWLPVDAGGVWAGSCGGGGGGVVVVGGSSSSSSSGAGFTKFIALSLRDQTLFEAIDTLQKRLENVGFGASLLGHGICRALSAGLPGHCARAAGRTIDTRAVEDLTGLAGWAGAVAFDL